MRKQNHFTVWILTLCLAVACVPMQSLANEEADPSVPSREELEVFKPSALQVLFEFLCDECW
jgi:hypothetical protein